MYSLNKQDEFLLSFIEDSISGFEEYLISYTNNPFQLLNTKNLPKAQNLLDHAIENGEYNRVLKLNFVLGEYFLTKGYYKKSENYFNSCFKSVSDNRSKASILVKMAESRIGLEDYLQGLEYLRRAKNLTLQDKKFQLQVNLVEAFCYANLQSKDASKSRIEILEKAVNSNDKFIYATILGIKALSFQNEYDYGNALSYFYKSNEILLNDSINLTSLFNLSNISKIYYQQNKYKQGVTFLNKAKDIAKVYGNKNIEARLLVELSLFYDKLNEWALAKEAIVKAQNNFREVENEKGGLKSDLRLLDHYVLMNNIDSASNILNKRRHDILSSLDGKNFLLLSQYYMLNNNPDSALIMADSGLDFCTSSELFLCKDLYKILASIYKSIGQYEKALKFNEQATALNDSIKNKLFSYNIQLVETELELQFKESVISNLIHENNVKNKYIVDRKKELEKQKSQYLLVIIVLLFTFLLVITLALWLRSNKKSTKRLAAINKKMVQQKEEIEVQSQHLIDTNHELQKLSIIARETDNGIKVMNATGRIIWINEGYTKMYGYKLEELQNIESFNLLGEQANINIQKLVNVWYGDKKPITFESLNKTKTGSEIWTQTTITPILNGNGKIDQMIAIDSDITRLKQAEKEIMHKNNDITASISYAKRIQEAMITPFRVITDIFPESFYYYKPKSIVSGDFYWMSKKNNKLVIACADCTGHGVPGAFMSLIGISFLNKIVNEKSYTAPDVILNRLRMNILNHLQQKNSKTTAADGIDMSVVTIDLKTRQMQYAGAMNPVLIIRGDDFIELRPDRMPVGFFDNEEKPFTSTNITLEKKDHLFMYTDGIYDQFGGESGSKFKSARFKELLKKVNNTEQANRINLIESEFNDWKGDYPQVDDVLLMGIQMN